MASITVPKQISPATINVFLGINESTDGDTELKLGEASVMKNWRVTDGMKLKKMEGYAPIIPYLGAGNINGMINFKKPDGTTTLIIAHGDKLYNLENIDV